MILSTKEFAQVCKTVLAAIDNKDTTLFTETLELKSNGDKLSMNITNREYFLEATFKLPTEETFHASVNASLFLNLISKLTTETLEITKENNSIIVRSNGNYKLPMIYANDRMLELPRIELNNVTNEMEINSSLLRSVADYNSKELLRGTAVKPVQKYFYIDEQGAITFTSGACVNSFTLANPIKMLLDQKVVGLFKLFKPDTPISFRMGQDALTEDLVQTKVEFKADNIVLTAKLKDTGLISSVPVTAIRGMANKSYTNSVVVNRASLLATLARILLFSDNPVGKFDFNSTSMVVSLGENTETIKYENEVPSIGNYSMGINLANFKLILDGAEDDYVTINFGDHKAVVVRKSNICDIIPERNNG